MPAATFIRTPFLFRTVKIPNKYLIEEFCQLLKFFFYRRAVFFRRFIYFSKDARELYSKF